MGFIGKPAAVPSKALLKNKFDHVPSFSHVDCYGVKPRVDVKALSV